RLVLLSSDLAVRCLILSGLLRFLTSLPPPHALPLFPYTTLFRSGAIPFIDGLNFKHFIKENFALPAAAINDGKAAAQAELWKGQDRKSTRLNSSHVSISYAVFCLKKKCPHTRCVPIYLPEFNYRQ